MTDYKEGDRVRVTVEGTVNLIRPSTVAVKVDDARYFNVFDLTDNLQIEVLPPKRVWTDGDIVVWRCKGAVNKDLTYDTMFVRAWGRWYDARFFGRDIKDPGVDDAWITVRVDPSGARDMEADSSIWHVSRYQHGEQP